jgi:hypothetical protein
MDELKTIHIFVRNISLSHFLSATGKRKDDEAARRE